MPKDIIYTIIIPHKNIPVLLQRCLDSIPKRDDVQIIVVDDNSSPEVVDFENFPGKEREDVQLIFEKEGRGGGYARNVGLKYAKGKWLIFADADDFFNYCIRDVLDEYRNSPYDIVYFKGNSVDTNTYAVTYRAEHLNKWIELYQCDKIRGELMLRYKFGEPWCKLICRELVEKYCIRFDEIPIHNDTKFSYLTGFYAKTVAVDRRAFYCVTTRERSVSVSADKVKELIRIKVFTELSLFLRSNNIPLKENLHFLQLCEFLLFNHCSFMRGVEVMRKKRLTKSEITIGILKVLPKVIAHHGKILALKIFSH